LVGHRSGQRSARRGGESRDDRHRAADGRDLTLTHEIPAEWTDYAQRTKAGWTTMTDAVVDALA